jgi:flagella basal body P-ring formation protein FlgA
MATGLKRWMLILAVLTATGVSRAAEVVIVTLRPMVSASDSQVRIADVADLHGGDTDLKQRIGRLDLSDLPKPGQTVQVSREQVSFRIRLAGIDPRAFRMAGAQRSVVHLGQCRFSEQEVVAAARQLLLKRLPWAIEDLTVDLAQPVAGPFDVAGSKSAVRLQPELGSTGALLGRVRLNVVFMLGDQRLREVPVYFEVKLHQQVAIATRRIERGESLGENNVRYERLAVDGMAGYLTAADGLTGRRAKRALGAGQIIAAVDAEIPPSEVPVIIKQRELVKLVAHTGPLILTTLGESMQDGHPGEIIRVRNIDSNRIVQGRVTGPSVVEVQP